MNRVITVLACLMASQLVPVVRADDAASVIGKQTDAEHGAVVALFSHVGFVCSGVVVAPRLVLTARHCAQAIAIRIGANATAAAEGARIVRRFTPPGRIADIAALLLDRDSSVMPYSVRTASQADAPAQDVTVVGFGHADARAARGAGVRRSWIAQPRGWGCSYGQSARSGCDPELEMVLGRDGGRDTCRGDSGGPVLERGETGWRVVAITSRSVRNSILTCGDGGIYVRVDRFADWLSPLVERWGDARR